MSSCKTIFEPALTGTCPDSTSDALDHGTMRGLFVGSKQNLYLVCDDPVFRFAVTLIHAKLPTFTFFRLGDLPVDNGAIVGTGKVRFGSACQKATQDFALGTLYAGEGSLSMLVRSLAGETWWQRVSYGSGGRVGWMSEEWSFLDDDGEVLFRNEEMET